MERVIHHENCFYVVENRKLINAQTKEEETKLRYTYVRNYTNDDICFIIIKNHFFLWDKIHKRAQELGVELLCQNQRYTYYHTTGEFNFVFGVKRDGSAFVIGRSFRPIYDNLYKIGRFAYQIVDGELEKLCECAEFERIDVRVEISAGENGFSEMLAFKKIGKRWEVVNHWRPGNIMPRKLKK